MAYPSNDLPTHEPQREHHQEVGKVWTVSTKSSNRKTAVPKERLRQISEWIIVAADYHLLFAENVRGWKVRPNGEGSGHCPFHEDEHSSFSANEDTGLWICHARCGSGNAWTFTKRLEVDPAPYLGSGKNASATHLSEMTQKDLSGSIPSQELPSKKKDQALGYHKHLLDKMDIICKPLPWREEAIRRTFTGFDKETELFTFLHLDSKGKAINIKWHKGNNSQPHSVQGHGSCRLYPLHLIEEYDNSAPLVFCEGEKDVLTLLTQGYNSATSTTGATGIPNDLSPLERFQKVVMVYDNDEPGSVGSIKMATALEEQFPKMNVLIHHWSDGYPEGYDVTDYFNDEGTQEGFDRMLADARRFQVITDTPDFNLTDAGNAELLLHLHEDKVRFDHTEGNWLIWNSQYWESDTKDHVVNYAIQAARYRQHLAVDSSDPDQKRKTLKHGLTSENKVKITSCLEIARGLEPVATVATDWNKEPHLLQFNNGTLNLQTMTFQIGRPGNMISQSVGYNYDREAQCPVWEKAILEIMGENSDMVSFLRRAFGYSLTSDTSEQCLFLLYGTGANGKGVVLDTARSVLGDYAKDSPFSVLEYRYGRSQSNDLARLHSARLVTSAESGESKRLDEERLKSITGCDPVSARFLYREYFTYSPKFKLWLAVNSLPRVNDFSFGFWRRIRLIPFSERFTGDRDDKDLRKKVRSEIGGILNWFLRGYQDWQEHGLMPPEEVVRATKDYQNESDVAAEFVDAFIEYNDDARIKAGTLYIRFCEWWEVEYKGKPISQTTFGRRVALVTGIKSDKIGGFKYYMGMKLKDDEDIPF